MKKRIFCLIITMLLLLQYGGYAPSSAADSKVQPAPEKLRVEASGDTGIEPAIGYNEYDKYYADLKCDPLKVPDGVSVIGQYINYYLQEVSKPYRPVKGTVLKEGSVPAKASGNNSVRLKDLSSGTVYYAYARAYYTYTKDMDTNMYTSTESSSSNTVKFLTDIDISATPYGPNQIKIEWDDVWNSGKRMDYKLYVSENKNFTNSPAIFIGEDQIGSNGPVRVNETTGKLEYIYTVRDPGRVYYIKIVPDTLDTELKMSAESKTVTVSSYILAQTTKMSVTDEGTIWKLEWSPVVTGLADSTVKVTYQIYKGTGTGSSVEQYVAATDDTSFFLTLKDDEQSNYYVIRALVTRNGQDVYPGIKIQSQKIYVKESEVPSKPPMPEIVDKFEYNKETVISYKDELKPTSATILWRAPLKGNGSIDENVAYDIWLITDPNTIDDPPSNTLVASNVKMNQSNYVMSGTKILGYKYTIKDLNPNTTYYVKIVAKKDYIQFVDNVLTNVTYVSDPAMKIVITPTLGPIDQPIVPGRPPLRVKKDSEGKEAVTSSTAVITIQNKWYEVYNPKANNGKGAWEYKTPTEIRKIGKEAYPDDPNFDLVKEIEEGKADPLKYRKVEYDDGVTIDVGCVEYTPDIDYDNLAALKTNKVIGVPVTPNDPDEDVTAEDAIPDGKKHNIDITLYDLDPNKSYVIWVRAARRGVELISGPSDPIIVTTNPDLPDILEKPTVPVFNYNYASDTYVDLGWNVNSKYTYYIEYGTVDDRTKASGKLTILPEELSYTSYYRIKGLSPDTLYYFWIQAEAHDNTGNKALSEFSDSYLVKTQKVMPPETPKGFGVKGAKDAVTKNSITFEWIMEDNMQYILEIDDDIDYKGSTKYEVGSLSEYTVENLRSNFRYYARLYAYDPEKRLASEPTQSITVRTLLSSDDYDSSEDIENVISGDYIVKDKYSVNGVWTIRIVGVNADRFIQHVQTDKRLDYLIDIEDAPGNTEKISVIISQRVFKALGMLGENLMLKTKQYTLVIRPGVLADSNGIYGSASSDANFIFDITLKTTAKKSSTANIEFKSDVSRLDISISDGQSKPVKKLLKPLKVVYGYNSADWYRNGVTSGYVFDDAAENWQRYIAAGSFDPDTGLGTASFETAITGDMAIGEPGSNYYDDIANSYAYKSIANVASVHELHFITGRKFYPNKYLTLGDAAKLMLDMLDVDYGSNYKTLAIKSGIAQKGDMDSSASNCTREKLIAMAVRVLELKTGEKASYSEDYTGVYKDMKQTSAAYLPKIKFAKEIGVITSRFSDTFGPKDPVTRAEAMVLLEKLLRYTGEL